jgi:hypothetical protein
MPSCRAASTLAEAALASAFPASGVLRARRVTALARDHRFDEASALLRQNATAEELETSAFFDLLSYHLTSEAATDTVALLTAVAERFPRRRLEAARIAAKHLEAKDRRQDAVAMLLPEAGILCAGAFDGDHTARVRLAWARTCDLAGA